MLLSLTPVKSRTPQYSQPRRPPCRVPLIDVPTVIKPNGVIEITLRDRLYTIRGLVKNTSHDALRVNIDVAGTNVHGDVGEHTDTLDLYRRSGARCFSSRRRKSWACKEDFIQRDLGRGALQLEELRDEQIETGWPARTKKPSR